MFWWGFLSGVVATVLVAGLLVLAVFRALDDGGWEDDGAKPPRSA